MKSSSSTEGRGGVVHSNSPINYYRMQMKIQATAVRDVQWYSLIEHYAWLIDFILAIYSALEVG